MNSSARRARKPSFGRRRQPLRTAPPGPAHNFRKVMTVVRSKPEKKVS